MCIHVAKERWFCFVISFHFFFLRFWKKKLLWSWIIIIGWLFLCSIFLSSWSYMVDYSWNTVKADGETELLLYVSNLYPLWWRFKTVADAKNVVFIGCTKIRGFADWEWRDMELKLFICFSLCNLYKEINYPLYAISLSVVMRCIKVTATL